MVRFEVMKYLVLAVLMSCGVAQAGLRGGPDGSHAGTPVANVPWEGVSWLLPALALGHVYWMRKRR